jgi:N-acyl-D-amino-acid deacylase
MTEAALPARFVLRGGTVVDGTGRAGYPADVVVDDGIIQLADPGAGTGAAVVDVDGLVVTPGFIDAHSHADLEMFLGPEAVDVHECRLLQGVTTEVNGNCGFSPFPFPPERSEEAHKFLAFVFSTAARPFTTLAEYTEAVSSESLACNVAPLVGHGTLRAAALGYEDRPATEVEMGHMEAALQTALDQGAFGLASGLCYTPATFAGPEEVQTLAARAARAGAIYSTHVRNETDGVWDAVDEALAVAEATGVALHISHLKVAGRRNWGSAAELLARLDGARSRGIDVTADAYPYTAGSTMLHSLLPPWLINEGIDRMLDRLADPGVRARVAAELKSGIPGWQNLGQAAGWDHVTVASSPRHPEREGRSIVELADASDRGPVDTISRVLLAERGQVLAIMEAMNDDDVRQFLGWEHTVVGSDGIPLPGKPHPRLTGTFPRVLARYRDVYGSLEEAVHRMTGATASRFKIPRRGIIGDGRVADLVVIDPDRVRDTGTYDDPWQRPAGIEYVMLAGNAVVWHGEMLDSSCGAVLRRA